MNNKRGRRGHLFRTELWALVTDRGTLLIFLAYMVFAFGACFSGNFRDTWMQVINGDIFVSLTNLYMPFFLMAAILLVISPIFAGDKKNGMEEVGDTCFYGKYPWKVCKVQAAFLYILVMCSAGYVFTLFMSLFSNTPPNFAQRAFEIGNSGIVMTNAQYYLFSFVLQYIGLLFLTSIVLAASSKSDDPIIPLAVGACLCGFELAFDFVVFSPILWEFNLFRLLKPFTILVPTTLFASPLKAILAVNSTFVILTALLVRVTLNGALKKEPKPQPDFLQRKT